jgi:hypothetical protein
VSEGEQDVCSFIAREADLITWSNNFQTRIAATPTVFGLTAAQATAFTTLNAAWVAAFTATASDATRTPSAIITKNAAKASMIASARQLAAIIQKFPGTTNTMRSDLGLNVPAQRTPIPIPDKSPTILVKKVEQNRVTLQLREPGSTSRGKPAGVAGMSVFSYVGTVPPADVVAWTFEGNTTRTEVLLEFPTSAEPFSQVWITAFYYNPRGMSGVATPPITTNLGTWLVAANNGQASPIEAATMKAAA